MRTLKESILDQEWDYDAIDIKTPFERELFDYFNSIDSDPRSGRSITFDPAVNLTLSIYNLAQKYLKPISREAAGRKKYAIRALMAPNGKVFEISVDNNRDKNYMNISAAAIDMVSRKPMLIAAKWLRVDCFEMDEHAFNFFKYLIDLRK